ncbi:hypothetical protein D9758_014792 [Tetrapyrgos nigripes]|uniref:Uncharacterized protein n=1 Tax=Tetrapyrgos nigripes TaxID=182062 RepID=A0A8H5FG81_9AGAR|nr:hypothetical protein D9758_014792 [Tetrapyrgos nigripes]
MPTRRSHSEAAYVLQRAFITDYITRIQAGDAQEDIYFSDSDSSESDSSSSGSDMSWDTSSTSSSDSEEEPTPVQQYVECMTALYSSRNLAPRQTIPKSQTFLHVLLDTYRHKQPELFQEYVRVDPSCFDGLVSAIQGDEVFHNNSNNPQMPVEEQVAIALYCFGHYGNAASVIKGPEGCELTKLLECISSVA